MDHKANLIKELQQINLNMKPIPELQIMVKDIKRMTVNKAELAHLEETNKDNYLSKRLFEDHLKSLAEAKDLEEEANEQALIKE